MFGWFKKKKKPKPETSVRVAVAGKDYPASSRGTYEIERDYRRRQEEARRAVPVDDAVQTVVEIAQAASSPSRSSYDSDGGYDHSHKSHHSGEPSSSWGGHSHSSHHSSSSHESGGSSYSSSDSGGSSGGGDSGGGGGGGGGSD